MKELVEVIAKSLVDYPDEVAVTETEEDNAVLVELKVAPADMGKVIGRQGKIAKAIRTVVKAASSKSDKKVVVITGPAAFRGGFRYRRGIRRMISVLCKRELSR